MFRWRDLQRTAGLAVVTAATVITLGVADESNAATVVKLTWTVEEVIVAACPNCEYRGANVQSYLFISVYDFSSEAGSTVGQGAFGVAAGIDPTDLSVTVDFNSIAPFNSGKEFKLGQVNGVQHFSPPLSYTDTFIINAPLSAVEVGIEWAVHDHYPYLNGGSIEVKDNFFWTAYETPLPATLPLFATGLGALALIARRRSRRASATCPTA